MRNGIFERGKRTPIVFIPQTSFICYQLSFYLPGLQMVKMVPENEKASSSDDVMLAGYRECATEALNWLLGLGYKPGHPLIKSLAAHLTKKQAYLEKLQLEQYLIEGTMKNAEVEKNDENEENTLDLNSKYDFFIFQVQNNKEIQKFLVDAAFKGCNLQYFNNAS